MRPERCPARIHPATGLLPAIVSALLFATCEAHCAGGLNAVVPVGPDALLLLRRGYADPAPRARPEPRSDVAGGLVAETLSAPQLATCGVERDLGSPVTDDDRREVPRFIERRARHTAPRKVRERVCAVFPAETRYARKPSRSKTLAPGLSAG